MARESHLQNFLEPENEIEKRDTQNGGDRERGWWKLLAWEDTRFSLFFLVIVIFIFFASSKSWKEVWPMEEVFGFL
jgi:hypothetical protein